MSDEPEIPAEEYDQGYFLSRHTEGYEEFRAGTLSPLKLRESQLLDVQPGMAVLEIGYGRGELLRHLARRGAKVSGVDYSPAAYEIGRETLREFPDADIRLSDCRNLPFPDASFDRVISGDVIEHLSVNAAVLMLEEARRVLKPGGLFLLHTAPNAMFVKVAYPLARVFLSVIDKAATARFDDHLRVGKRMHVHEYNLLNLRRVLKRAHMAGARTWIDPDILRTTGSDHTQAFRKSAVVRLAGKMGLLWPVRFFFGNDLYARYVKD